MALRLGYQGIVLKSVNSVVWYQVRPTRARRVSVGKEIGAIVIIVLVCTLAWWYMNTNDN
jgi:hypothetical protein